MEPAVILNDRKNENGTRDFLVKWGDGEEDTWVGHLALIELSGACSAMVHLCYDMNISEHSVNLPQYSHREAAGIVASCHGKDSISALQSRLKHGSL